jgi:hypothetical protein
LRICKILGCIRNPNFWLVPDRQVWWLHFCSFRSRKWWCCERGFFLLQWLWWRWVWWEILISWLSLLWDEWVLPWFSKFCRNRKGRNRHLDKSLLLTRFHRRLSLFRYGTVGSRQRYCRRLDSWLRQVGGIWFFSNFNTK